MINHQSHSILVFTLNIIYFQWINNLTHIVKSLNIYLNYNLTSQIHFVDLRCQASNAVIYGVTSASTRW